MLNIQNITLALIFLILSFTVQPGFALSKYEDLQYLFYFVLLFVILIRALASKKITLPKLTFIDIIPALFLIVWLYGLLLGFILGNNPEGIVRNFAGMTFYFLYYIFLYLRLSKERIFNTVYGAALINIVTAIIVSSLFYKRLLSGEYAPYLTESGALRSYYSAGLFTIFVLISTLGASFLIPKEKYLKYYGKNRILFAKTKKSRLFFLLLGMFCIIFVTASKGFILVLAFMIITIPLSIFFKRIISFKFNIKMIIFSLFFIAILAVILHSETTTNIISVMFSSEESSNATRSSQTQDLLNETTFFGSGLGGVLVKGEARDELGYGFEVSYINTLHKFGVFALILFAAYIYTFLRIFALLINGKNIKYAAAAVGAMCFMIPSIGNPTLFSAPSVILHCMALYIIREDFQPDKNLIYL